MPPPPPVPVLVPLPVVIPLSPPVEGFLVCNCPVPRLAAFLATFLAVTFAFLFVSSSETGVVWEPLAYV